MGKAIIISHAGSGKYVVDVVYDADYIQNLIDRLSEDYASLQFNDLLNAINKRDTEKSKTDAAISAVDIAIIDYNTDPTEDNLKNVNTLTINALKQSEAYITATTELSFVKSRMDSIHRKIEILRSHQTETHRDILWCVDLADGKRDRRIFDAGDEVATAEISGQEELGQVLLASYAPNNADYDGARDGRLMNIAALSEFELFYNMAILPGWQKWRHRYRTGIIIDGDPGTGWTVRLDNTKSSLAWLPEGGDIEVNNIAAGFANEQRELIAVQAVYMNCDNFAFGVGDHVVVDVTISGDAIGYVTAPTIIGFVDHPKSCYAEAFGYHALNGVDASEWQKIALPATGGTWAKQTPYSNDLTTTLSSSTTVFQWIGINDDQDAVILEWANSPATIFKSGEALAVLPTGYDISGAAITRDNKYLYCICNDGSYPATMTVMRKTNVIDLTGDLYDAVTAPNGWEVQNFNMPDQSHCYNSGGRFHFNASCNLAVAYRDYVHGVNRVPQPSPPAGDTWETASSYDTTWRERTEIAISNGSADTLSNAGVTLTGLGVQSSLVEVHEEEASSKYGSREQVAPDGINYIDGTVWRRYGYANVTKNYLTKTYSGKYEYDTGFIGNDEIVLSIAGNGSYSAREDGSSTVQKTTYDFDITEVGIIKSSNIISGERSFTFYSPLIGLDEYKEYQNIDSQDLLPHYGWDGYPDAGLLIRTERVTETRINGEQRGFEGDKGFFAVISHERDRVWGADWNWQPNSCYHTIVQDEVVDFESCGVWLGQQVFTDSSPSSNSTDGGYTGFLSCLTGVDAQAANYSEVVDWPNTPPYQVPENTESSATYAYDMTAIKSRFTALTVSGGLDNAYAARSPQNKFLGAWRTNINASESYSQETFLTGGNIEALTEISGTITFGSIHVL